MPKCICITHKRELDANSDCRECLRDARRGLTCVSCGDVIGPSFGAPDGSPRVCLDCYVMDNSDDPEMTPWEGGWAS